MNWASRRKHVIEAILIVCAIALIAVVFIATLYKAPSCNDGKQNQKEQGIDCGGPCPYACEFSESPPAVRFVRAISPQPGRTDVIAYLDNSNNNAELVNAPYTIDLYGPSHAIVARKTGVISIPPSTTLPLYIPDFYENSTPVDEAFLNFTTTSYTWLRTTEKPIVPIPSDISIQDGASPKITAALGNPTANTLYGITVVATVFNSANNAIAASQTFITQIPPQSTAPLVFTWNEAFSSKAARVEILLVPGASSPTSS
jgi:hypothetical protein